MRLTTLPFKSTVVENLKIRFLYFVTMPWTVLGFFVWLMGHDVLPARVSGHDYRNFLWTHWSGLLESLSFGVHLCMWFIHDGASPHCSCVVHDWRSEIILDDGLVTGVKLQFPGLHAHICVCVCVYVSVFADQGQLQVQLIPERNCRVRFNSL
jgi:hypothetical protein